MELKMKYVCLLLSIALTSATLSIENKQAEKRGVIGLHSNGAGLFAGVFGALNNIIWCKENSIEPIVVWDASSPYYVEEGYNGRKNVWEYYFEQVSSSSYQRHDEVISGYNAPSGQAWLPGFPPLQCSPALNKEYRRTIYALLEKYVKVKPVIMEKVESYYKKNIAGKMTIGIHLRGTDIYTEIGKPVERTIIFDYANSIAQEYPGCQFFVATDEQKLLEEAKKNLNGKVIYYDTYRSLDGKPMHLYAGNKYNKALMGEEVLIEVLLLARCNKFLHTCSNVACAVTFFNPELDSQIFLNENAFKK